MTQALSTGDQHAEKLRPWYRFCRIACRFYMISFHFGRAFNPQFVPLSGPVLLVSNHQSFLDPVIATYALDREGHYMARESLFHNRLFRKLIVSLNAFPVKRGEVDVAAIKQTLRLLKADKTVLLFPEGTRTTDGRIRPFKPGVALLAKKAAVPVVPVVIDGAFEAWPRTSPLPRPLAPIHVAYGRPFTVRQFHSWSPERFVRELHRRMIDMQHELRRRFNRPMLDYSDNYKDK